MLFSQQILELIRNGIGETLCMVIISTVVSYIIGIPLGIILVVTDKEGIRPVPVLQKVLGLVINLLRSIPHSSDHDDPSDQKDRGNEPWLESSGAAACGICGSLHCPHGRIIL